MKLFNRYGLILVLTLALCILLIGCGGSSSTTSEGTPPKSDNKSTETKPTENKPTETTASTSGDKVGVAECDEYLEKYEACINGKVPEAARVQVKSSLEISRKAWKDTASTSQGKAGLTTICKSALEQAKQSMGAYGCSW